MEDVTVVQQLANKVVVPIVEVLPTIDHTWSAADDLAISTNINLEESTELVDQTEVRVQVERVTRVDASICTRNISVETINHVCWVLDTVNAMAITSLQIFAKEHETAANFAIRVP